jgi:hypothetical protein
LALPRSPSTFLRLPQSYSMPSDMFRIGIYHRLAARYLAAM